MNVEHLVEKMKTTVKRGLILRWVKFVKINVFSLFLKSYFYMRSANPPLSAD